MLRPKDFIFPHLSAPGFPAIFILSKKTAPCRAAGAERRDRNGGTVYFVSAMTYKGILDAMNSGDGSSKLAQDVLGKKSIYDCQLNKNHSNGGEFVINNEETELAQQDASGRAPHADSVSNNKLSWESNSVNPMTDTTAERPFLFRCYST